MCRKRFFFPLFLIVSAVFFTSISFGYARSSDSDIFTTEDLLVANTIFDGLFINEILAVNQITIGGPDGTYPDWIELFNAGNETVDLSGMFLTDDLSDPTSWRFPDGTLIESAGYLLVWADNSSDQNSLHANFRLTANGEEVGLFASDGVTLIDSVTFAKQLGDVSYGRSPDGSPNWTPLLRATPGWGNNETQINGETSIWSILLVIGIIIVLGLVVLFAGKISERRKSQWSNIGNDA